MYTLQIDGRNQEDIRVKIRDMEIRTVKGVKADYAYTGRITADDPARAALRDLQGEDFVPVDDYLSNGDRVEITRSDIPGWYQVQIRDSSNPEIIGRIWWIERWLVDDEDVPPRPTATPVPPTAAPAPVVQPTAAPAPQPAPTLPMPILP
jgi:hypothetical protein